MSCCVVWRVCGVCCGVFNVLRCVVYVLVCLVCMRCCVFNVLYVVLCSVVWCFLYKVFHTIHGALIKQRFVYSYIGGSVKLEHVVFLICEYRFIFILRGFNARFFCLFALGHVYTLAVLSVLAVWGTSFIHTPRTPPNTPRTQHPHQINTQYKQPQNKAMQNNTKQHKTTPEQPHGHHSPHPYDPIPTDTKPESSHRTERNRAPNLTHI